jgi:hypothetical protein
LQGIIAALFLLVMLSVARLERRAWLDAPPISVDAHLIACLEPGRPHGRLGVELPGGLSAPKIVDPLEGTLSPADRRA